MSAGEDEADDADELRSWHNELRTALEDATVACETIARRLEFGAPPPDQSLADIQLFSTLFTQNLGRLRNGATADTVDELLVLYEAQRREQQRESVRLNQLRALAAAQAEPMWMPMLSALCVACADLVRRSGSWEAEDRALADRLGGVWDLAMGGVGSVDTVASALPEPLRAGVLLITGGHVTLIDESGGARSDATPQQDPPPDDEPPVPDESLEVADSPEPEVTPASAPEVEAEAEAEAANEAPAGITASPPAADLDRDEVSEAGTGSESEPGPEAQTAAPMTAERDPELAFEQVELASEPEAELLPALEEDVAPEASAEVALPAPEEELAPGSAAEVAVPEREVENAPETAPSGQIDPPAEPILGLEPTASDERDLEQSPSREERESPTPTPVPEPEVEAAPAPTAASATAARENGDAMPVAPIKRGSRLRIVPLAERRPRLDQTIAERCDQRRFGAAYWLTIKAHGSGPLAVALEALACASAARGGHDSCALRANELLQSALSGDALDNDSDAQLVALAATIRAGAAAYAFGDILPDAGRAVLADDPEVLELLDALRDVARRGPLTEAVGAESQRATMRAQDRVLDLGVKAGERLDRPGNLKFPIALLTWKEMLRGEFGTHLRSVRDDDRRRVDAAVQFAASQRRAGAIVKYINDVTNTVGEGGKRKKIVGAPRNDLVARISHALDLIEDWAARVEELSAEPQHAHPVVRPVDLDRLRGALKELPAVLAAINRRRKVAPIGAAALAATLADLGALINELKPLVDTRLEAAEAIGLELLLASAIPLTTDLIPADDILWDGLQALSADGDWEAAFEVRLGRGELKNAWRICDVLRRRRQDAALAERLDRRLHEAIEEELKKSSASVTADAGERLERAWRNGVVDDTSKGQLQLLVDGLTEDVDIGADSLGEAIDHLEERKSALAAFVELLDECAAQAVATARPLLQKRIAALPPGKQQELTPIVDRLLEQGDVTSAEDSVLAAKAPSDEPPDLGTHAELRRFFPGFVDEWSASPPSWPDIRATLEAKSLWRGLDFGAIQVERRQVVVAAVQAWGRLWDRRALKDLQADLHLVLRGIGFAQARDVRPGSAGGSPNLRRVGGTFKAHGTSQHALVPEFGSLSGGQFALMLSWDSSATAESLSDWIAEAAAPQATVLLHFGVLRSEVRRALARQVRSSRTPTAVCVVDDAAFLHACVRGDGRLTTLMQIALPFTAVTPYRARARELPPELFKGREGELEAVQGFRGGHFVYGGRRLGKSALMARAKQDLVRRDEKARALYHDLEQEGIGRGALRPIDVFAVLNEMLADAGITTLHKRAQPVAHFQQTVKSWLKADPGHRLLMLLDEADALLDADAEENFRVLRLLKDLMEDHEDRFKVVFAGLHMVQRFQSMPNQPFAHLGADVCVGPLPRKAARALVLDPLRALGFEFTSRAPVERILTHTQCHPNLIQHVCEALLRVLYQHPFDSGPPYEVGDQDVARLLEDTEIHDMMRDRFALSLTLDARYQVIANVIALHDDPRNALTPAEVQQEASVYWPQGFQDVEDDEMRSLLDEMRGLGILTPVGPILIRASSVERMLGSDEEIRTALRNLRQRPLEKGFDARTHRVSRESDGWRASPLTEGQLRDLCPRRRQVRILLGTPATGIEHAVPTLSRTLKRESIDAVQVGTARCIKELRKPVKFKHRTVLVDAVGGDLRWVPDLIDGARAAVESQRTGTVSAILVTDINGAIALGALPGHLPKSGPDLVSLRRWSTAGLRAWSFRFDNEVPFATDERLELAQALTGGWPSLVERFVTAYNAGDGANWELAMQGAEHWLDDPEEAADFVTSTGLEAVPGLRESWDRLYESCDLEPFSREDLVVGVLDGDEATLERMLALDLLNVSNEELALEPVLARACARARVAG